MFSAPERVAESFNQYFAGFGCRITPAEVVIGSRRTIFDQRSGWRITYRVDPDDVGEPNLEFYATNRFTSDRHVRIFADGRGGHLEAMSESFFHDPSKPEFGAEEFRTRNKTLMSQLQDRGLYPGT